jgi:hypothetical protein
MLGKFSAYNSLPMFPEQLDGNYFRPTSFL